MFFSVVIPVFNRDPALALQSVRAQTFGDFECIVVDDGSANGAEISAAVEALGDPRFRYVRRENGGGGAARNTGISEAKGEWLAFLDSDDFWLPGKLDQDREAVRPNTVLFSQVMLARNGELCEIRPRRGPHPGENISEYLVRRQGWTQTSTMVVPASVASRFSEYARFGQDTDFALKLADEGLRFVMHPESLVIMEDSETGDRVSRSADWERAWVWTIEVAHLMTPRALLAYRGWHIARLAAQAGHWKVGLSLWWRAFIRGALPLPLAVKALGQIILKRSAYRALASGTPRTSRSPPHRPA